ncbi:MAG: hypothetical protein CMC13_00555 [Flavobacteriaceae bacterium]|nr:hypothetical protein [Flavobacteriaceae bacterium]|tara:strand:+ start:244 stop:678 length:435 start_codon:yes stop_codon:yes gene_type:complete
MKLQTIALAAFLFTTVGTVAQVEVSTKKVTAQKTTAPFEGEIETIVVKKVDDAEITSEAQTEKDKKAAAAIAKMKAERQAEKQKASAALLEKARKEGLVDVSDEEKEKRMEKIEAQKKKYEERKNKQQKKLERKTEKYNKKIDN